jgi:hypothetical protein
MRKYLGLVALYVFLAVIVVLGNRAHSTELMPEPDPECLAFSNEGVPHVHSLFVSKTPVPIIKYLILSAELGDAGRWLLFTVVEAMEAMEVAEAHGKRMSESDALELGALLCRFPTPGQMPALQREERVRAPQEI